MTIEDIRAEILILASDINNDQLKEDLMSVFDVSKNVENFYDFYNKMLACHFNLKLLEKLENIKTVETLTGDTVASEIIKVLNYAKIICRASSVEEIPAAEVITLIDPEYSIEECVAVETNIKVSVAVERSLR